MQRKTVVFAGSATLVAVFLTLMCILLMQISDKLELISNRLERMELATAGDSSTGPEFNDDLTGELIIVRANPSFSEQGVSVDSRIEVVFNKELDPTALEAGHYRISHNKDDIDFSVAAGESSDTVILMPAEALVNDQTYSVLIKEGILAADGSSFLASHAWSFNTVAIPPFTEGADLVASWTAGSSDAYLHYVLVLDNQGPDVAIAPKLTGSFPQGEFEYTSPNDTRSYCSFPEMGGSLEILCEFPDLEAGKAYDVAITITLDEGSSTNGLPSARIEATSETYDPDLSNNVKSSN